MKTKLILALTILAVPLLAQEHRIVTVTMCYKKRTINVPTYLVPRWVARGATPGACL